MTSIRLSLMVCFLALLAVALLAASLLVYHNAEQTLDSKQRAMETLIQTQYRQRCENEEARLDHNLLLQAQSLARLVQVQFDRSRLRMQPLFLLGLLTAQQAPSGYLPAWTWIAAGYYPRPQRPQRGESSRADSLPPEPPNPLYFNVMLRLTTTGGYIKLRDEMLLPGDTPACDYFQIDYPRSKSYFSASISGWSFPLDEAVFPRDQLIHAVYDNRIISKDVPVRRVVLKASDVEKIFWPSRWFGADRRREGARFPGVFQGPTIYVHCAVRTEPHDAVLAGFRRQRDEELAKVADETRASLHHLLIRLLAISLSVFGATGIVGFWLVPLGLAPLRRVSDAVSCVSTKDFRLPLDERPLPRELRPIVERLRNTLDLLKRAFAREKQAAADISHELRTPLAALMTTAELALRRPRSPEQYRELLGDVYASAQQMHQIVDRLLTLARLDAGVDRLRMQTVDVAALAQQCADLIRPLAEARGLTLAVKAGDKKTRRQEDKKTRRQEDKKNEAKASVSLSPCLPVSLSGLVVQSDPDKLREIVTNLLHNAIQYNRPGGVIDLRVGRENGKLQVEVQDTGIGMSPETCDRIFERFYRADPSRGGDDLHAGLGLAIVKEYIDLMGGSIGVESTPGQGSTFRVQLPTTKN